jgi:hypothetical protein
MEINWSIVGWIAGLIFVYIFGLFEGRGQGYKKRKAEETLEKQDQPPPPPETLTVTVDDPGLLRIKNENGTIALDIDGTRVTPTSLLPEQRKRLIELLNIMRPWLEGRTAPAPSMTPPPSPPKPMPLEPAQDQPAQSHPVSSSSTAVPQPGTPKPTIIAPEDRPAAPANSIVTQIDSILQARLEGTPLDDRGIFLTQSADGGVIVYIGLTRYNGIDEVTDPEVKAAIRGAIAEWENKYTPGL